MKKAQTGVMLVEALVGLMIFVLGILGVIGMQATATKLAADSQYRSEAALFADRLLSQIWTDDPANLLDYVGDSDGNGGARYTAWMNEVTAAGTGLPGVEPGTFPTVSVDTQVLNGYTIPRVTVEVRWRAPGEADSHRYVTSSNVSF